MSVQSITVTYLLLTVSLIFAKVLIVGPALAESDVFRDDALDVGGGFNNSTQIKTDSTCIRGEKSLLDTLIDASLGILVRLANANKDVCFQQFDFLSGSALFLGLSGLVMMLGAATMLAGFLTSAASRGAIAMVGYGLVIGGAMGIALSLVEPLFKALPVIGAPFFVVYAIAGFVLTLHTGLSYLAGSGS